MGINQTKIIEENGLSEDSVIVVGIVKNVRKSIKVDISRIEKSLKFFKETSWYLVESGSSDRSIEVLDELVVEKKNFKYISLDDSSRSETSRTEILAFARNQYLNYIRENNILERYKYVVIADFNLLNNKISIDSVLSSWLRTDWDVVTANQDGPYYDIWALRHQYWSPNDCWEHHAFLMKYLKFPEKAVTYSMRARMIKIPRKSEWIQVDSAFGGLAIYRSKILNMICTYRGVDQNNKIICEHVPFHNQLTESGAQIFVNPYMINTNYTDHSLRISGTYIAFRIVQYPYKLVRRFTKDKSLDFWQKNRKL